MSLKTHGIGKGGFKRHRKERKTTLQGITKPAIRRLARRGGVKRISGLIYEETRDVFRVFLEQVLRQKILWGFASVPLFPKDWHGHTSASVTCWAGNNKKLMGSENSETFLRGTTET